MGEDGWELHVPQEYASSVYETLMAEGEEHKIRPGGYYAIESMRISRGYRAWGHELSPDDNPFEAGLSFAVDLSKGAFIGKEAVAQLKEIPRTKLSRRLVSVALDDSCQISRGDVNRDKFLWGGETIHRDGVVVGYLRSAAYVEPLDVCGGMGYVKNEAGVDNTFLSTGTWTVNLAGKHLPAKVTLKSLMDAFYVPK